jgi:hypothetical protein
MAVDAYKTERFVPSRLDVLRYMMPRALVTGISISEWRHIIGQPGMIPSDADHGPAFRADAINRMLFSLTDEMHKERGHTPFKECAMILRVFAAYGHDFTTPCAFYKGAMLSANERARSQAASLSLLQYALRPGMEEICMVNALMKLDGHGAISPCVAVATEAAAAPPVSLNAADISLPVFGTATAAAAAGAMARTPLPPSDRRWLGRTLLSLAADKQRPRGCDWQHAFLGWIASFRDPTMAGAFISQLQELEVLSAMAGPDAKKYIVYLMVRLTRSRIQYEEVIYASLAGSLPVSNARTGLPLCALVCQYSLIY